jgi:peptidyl-prolyl cis-trans isomerase C
MINHLKTKALHQVLLMSLMAFSFLGCTAQNSRVSAQQPLVKVNSRTLTLKDFSNQLGRRLKDLDSLSAKSSENLSFLKEEIIKNFITRSLVLDFADSKGVIVSNQELGAEAARLRASYPDDVTFRRALAEENFSFSEWQEQLKARLVEKKVFDLISEKTKAPTAEELQLFYQQNLDSFKTKERVYLRQIVVEDQGKADHLKNELKKQTLESLAKKYSIAPEGRAGGLVGWIGKGEVDFFDPTFSYKLGTPGPIFKSPFGFHIVQIERKTAPSTLAFEEVRSRIERSLRAQKEQALFTEWLDAQLRSGRVWRDYNLINSVRVDTK